MKILNCLCLYLVLYSTYALCEPLYTVEDSQQLTHELRFDSLIEPIVSFEITAPAKVILEKQYASFGEYVPQGSPLFDLTSEEVKSQYAQAKLEYLESQQNLEKVCHWKEHLEYLQAKDNQTRQAQQYQQSKQRYTQTLKLYEAGIVSKEECHADHRALLESEQNYIYAKLSFVQVQKKGSQQAIELAKLQCTKAKYHYEHAKRKMTQLRVIAPFSGILLPVVKNKKDYAQYTASYQKQSFKEGDSIALLANTEQLALKVLVDEYEIAYMKRGEQAKIILKAFAPVTLSGVIESVQPVASQSKENQQAYYEVLVSISEIPPAMRKKILLGMSAQVAFSSKSEMGYIVPKTALVLDKGKFLVKKYSAENERDGYKLEAVEIGDIAKEHVLITSGLAAGEQIVVGHSA